jgi:hypothetical protein
MTKAVKWWKAFSFWDKVRVFLGAIGIGGEITIYVSDVWVWWRAIAAIATGLSIWLTFFIKDENKNGVVDAFEKFFKKSK